MSTTMQLYLSDRPGRVAIAGWASIVMGALGALASVGLAVMVLINTADLEVEPGTPVGLYRVLLLALMTGGILLALAPVVLGVAVMRGSLVSRYVLIAYWVCCGLAAFIGVGVLEATLPVLLVMGASVAVPVLLAGRTSYSWYARHPRGARLIEAETWMREDEAGGSGVIALAVAVLGAAMVLGSELAGLGGLEKVAVEPILLAYLLGALWLSMRALHGYGNRVWASAAVVIVIATPLVSSAVGLIGAVTVR